MTRASDLAKLLTGGRTLGGTGEVIVKDIDTADGSSPKITLQTGDTDIASADVLGTIDFQAPDEGTGTDAILVAAGIEAVSEGDFSSSSNATSLVLKTGASEAAAEKVRVDSAGRVGIGITPDTTSNGKSLQINRSVINDDDGGSTHIAQNGYYNSAWKYVENGTAEKISFASGATTFSNATSNSGGADASLTWVDNMVIDANGHITMPKQPAFLAENSDHQNNLSNNTLNVITLATERFDLNGDFNNSTHTFTAPVTGK